MLGSGPLERNFANGTHIIVSLLKAWKVTVVGIKCDDPSFNSIPKKFHTRNCSFNFFLQNSAC